MQWVLRAGEEDLEKKLKEIRLRDLKEKIAEGLVRATTEYETLQVNILIEQYIKEIGTPNQKPETYSQNEFDERLGKVNS